MKNNLPYNVMRHNDWDRAPRDPVSAAIASSIAGGSFATFGAALAGSASFGWYAAYAVSTLAISAVTSAVLSALAPKPSLGSQGLLVNSRDAIAPAQFVYGEVRKGGNTTYLSTTGTKNKILHMVIVLAGHRVQEIGDIYLNDEIVTMSNEDVTSAPYNGLVKIYKHLGNQTSASTAFANSSKTLANTLHSETDVDSSFVGKGLAYLYCRFEYDQDAFSNGLPNVTAMVKGKRIVKTVNGVNQAAAYTNNAAWCIKDFLESNYGLKDGSAIDPVTFEAAAAVCDDTSVLSDGSPQYTINGVINSAESYGDVLQNMMTACGGTLFWGGGKWRLYAGAYVAPTKILTLDDFRSGISIDTKVPMRDNFNTVRGTFNDKDNDYITADYPEVTSSLFKQDDKNEEVALDLTLPYTTSSIAAQRLAKQMLYRSREQLTLSADFGMNAFDIEVGDFIKIRNDRYGWIEGAEKTFEVTGWKLAPQGDAGDLRINLQLRESSQAAFGFTVQDEKEILSNNTTLLKYYEVPSVGVTWSQEYREVNENVVNVLVANITSDAIERVDSVIVKYKKTSDAKFKSVGQAILVDEGDDAGRFEIVGIDVPQLGEAPINYTVSVTPMNTLGFRGQTITTNFNITADTTPPDPPAAFEHSLSGGTIFFTWDAVEALDLSHYRLWYSSNPSANFGDASTLLKISKIARPATSITHPALAGKYFITAVDKTGNESATATSLVVASSELPQLGEAQTSTEHSTFSGSKSNLTVSGGNLFMTTYTSAGATGTYSFYHNGAGYFDVGTSRTVRLSYTITVNRKHLDAVSGSVNWDSIPQNWDTWPDNWDTWTNENADFGDFAVQVQARSSVNATSWSSWQDASGELVGRYIQFRAVLSNSNARVTPNITALTATVEY